MKRIVICLVSAVMISGCGGGGGGTALPPGENVVTPEFETYTTAHNGRNRVRSKIAVTPQEQAVLDAFDSPAGGPAGYLSMIDISDTLYDSKMTIEVIAEVDEDGKATRLLRLTADQSEFVNERGGTLIEASGKYYFRGASYAWVAIDDQALLSGYDRDGLVNLVLDFDAQTASINMRTGVQDGSETRVELTGVDLPFNIRTGAYGGDVTIQVLDPALEGEIQGSLRGNVGGTPEYTDNQHDMTTSGLYSGSGTLTDLDGDHTVSVYGIYFGRDPNASP